MQASIILTCSSCHEKLNFYMKVIDSNVVLRVYKCENCKKSAICSVCGEGVVYKKGVCQDCYEYEAHSLLTPLAQPTSGGRPASDNESKPAATGG